jgi:hypothetical protein
MNGRARALVEALEPDFSVTVVCEQTPGLGPSRAFRKAELLEYPLAFGTRSLFHIGGAIRVIQMAILGVIQIVRTKAKIVICADAPYCLAGLFAKRVWGCRFVFDSYEIIWGLGAGRFLSALFKRLERFVLKRCDLWLVPSELRARIVLEEQALNLPHTVIPNLPAAGKTRTNEMTSRLRARGVPSNQVTVLYQGGLLPRRGLPELLEVAARGRFHLIVQGHGPLRALVEASAGPNVTVLPPCSNDESVSWLSAVTASFVCYENDCINSASACSSKLYASMIAGTPVICNDLPALRQFSQEHGGCAILETLDSAGIEQCVEVLSSGAYRALKAEAIKAGSVLNQFPRASILQHAMHGLLE